MKYNTQRKERFFKGIHLIMRHSVYGQMVCGLLEHGLSLHHATLLVEVELKKDGTTEVGASYT